MTSGNARGAVAPSYPRHCSVCSPWLRCSSPAALSVTVTTGMVTTIAGRAGQRGLVPGRLLATLSSFAGVAVSPPGDVAIVADNALIDISR